MKSFLNYSKNRILYSIFRMLFVFLTVFLVSKCDVKAEEQYYSIDVLSFIYGGYMGDLNTGCTFQTRTQTLSSNFSQYFTLTGGGYCSTEPSGMALGLNITTDIEADTYYTITEELHFSGSVYYLQSAINVYTQCGIYTSSGWNMSACEDISVTATPVTNGYASIKITFKPKVNGTKLTFSVGSLAEGYKMFYVDENSEGSFKLNNLIVDKLTSSSDEGNTDLGPIINQNQTIINQNQTIINQNSQTNEKLDKAEETRKGIWDTIKDLPNMFLDMFKSLFIPDDDYFENWFNDLQAFFEEKLGFLATPFSIFIEFVERYLSLDSSDEIIINIPEIRVPNFENAVIVEATVFNWTSLLKSKEVFNNLWQLYLSFIDVYLILNFINLCMNKYNAIFGGDTTNYEYYTVEDSYTYDNNTGEVLSTRRNERKTTRKKVDN